MMFWRSVNSEDLHFPTNSAQRVSFNGMSGLHSQRQLPFFWRFEWLWQVIYVENLVKLPY